MNRIAQITPPPTVQLKLSSSLKGILWLLVASVCPLAPSVSAQSTSSPAMQMRPGPEIVCPGCGSGGGNHGGGGGTPPPAVTYPTFTTSNEYINIVMSSNGSNSPAVSTDLYSPSAASCAGYYWLAYTDQNGTLQVYENTSPTSISYSPTFSYNVGAPPGSRLSMACSNGLLYFAFNANGTLSYFTISMSNFSQVASGTLYTSSPEVGDPAIEDINGLLYVAFVQNAAGYNGLYYPQVFITTDFKGTGQLATGSQEVYYPVVNSPALSQLNGALAIVWLTGNNQNPVVVVPPVGQLGATSASQINETNNIMIGGSPAAVNFNNALFIFGRSYYSADNLWALGTADGINFVSQQKYGQSLRGDPSLTVFNGTLAQAGRSNYTNDLWIYTATY